MLDALVLAAVLRPLREGGAVRVLGPAEGHSDESLVLRAQGGDRWAEEALYRRHVRHVTGMVTRLLRRHEDAEDVVQETFVIALDQLHALRSGAAVRGWLSQIAVSLVRKRFRRQKLRRLLGLEVSQEDATLERLASADASPELRAELLVLDGLLSSLPIEHRIAWSLRHVEGEQLEDVARLAGCSLATAKRRIAAAEERIKHHVALEPEGA
jgi:RNA polymerase sigma-70 factor, ECF subfamily